MSHGLDLDFFDPHAREGAAMPLGVALCLPALLLEHADLRPARLRIHDADHLHVCDKRCPGEHFAPVLLEEEDAIDADLVAGLRVEPVDLDDAAGGDLHLPPAALNDSEHDYCLLDEGGKTLDYHGSYS